MSSKNILIVFVVLFLIPINTFLHTFLEAYTKKVDSATVSFNLYSEVKCMSPSFVIAVSLILGKLVEVIGSLF